MTGLRIGPRIEAAFLTAVGLAVAASWLRWHHLALPIIGAFLTGIGASALYTALRRSPAHRRQDAMIRDLWSTVKRWPTGQTLTDPATGGHLKVERERGFLTLAIREAAADNGQVPMVTRYLLGWLAAPNPPPLFRHTTAAHELSPVRMSLNQAGSLLAFNDQTGAMEATTAELVELRQRLDRTIAAATRSTDGEASR